MKRLHSRMGAVSAAVAALAISACSTMSPIQTNASYNPGDGVPASSGPVSALNLLVVADVEGGPGALSGSLLNTGVTPVQVGFQTREESEASATAATPLTLGGREQKLIDDVTFPSMAVGPGSWTEIYLVTSAGRTLVNVPVLPPAGFYATLRPTGATSTPATSAPATGATSTARAEAEPTTADPEVTETP